MNANERFDQLLRGGDVEEVAAFFRGIPESKRGPYARKLAEWWPVLDHVRLHGWRSDADFTPEERKLADTFEERVQAASAALMWCGAWADVHARLPSHLALRACAAPLLERRPPWLSRFVEACCEIALGRFSCDWWPVLRMLVSEGAIPAPDHPSYALAALEGIWLPRERDTDRTSSALATRLLRHPDWLQGAFWLLFAHDGNTECSLSNVEKYSPDPLLWTQALVSLSSQGVLDRQRLLDASLAALARDFIQYRAGWFSRFHEALEPTPEERTARLDAYLGQLGSGIPPTVSFAMNAVSLLARRVAIPAPRLIPALRPALSARAKGTVLEALELLSTAAGVAKADVQRQVALEAVAALLHSASPVQSRALDVVMHFGRPDDAELSAKLAEVRDGLAATARKRLDEWLGSSVAQPLASKPSPPAKKPTVVLAAEVAPLSSLTDLLDAAGHVLEHSEDTLALERVLDGVARLGAAMPADAARLVGPLRKQAEAALKRRASVTDLTRRLLAEFLLAWLDAKRPLPIADGDNVWMREDALVDWCANRLSAILARVRAGHGVPLLAAPDLASGAVRLSTLLRLHREWGLTGQVADPAEQALAILRVEPEAGTTVPVGTGDEFLDALRFALGGAAVVGSTPVLWLTAARRRCPRGDCPEVERAFPSAGPDGACAARYEWTVKFDRSAHGFTLSHLRLRVTDRPDAKNLPDHPGLRHHHPPKPTPYSVAIGGSPMLDESAWRWHASFGSAFSEAWFFRGCHGLFWCIDGVEADQRSLREVVLRLSQPGLHPGPMATLALTIALGCRDDLFSLPAAEALATWIDDGRFSADALAETMSRLLHPGCTLMARWAARLSTLLSRSPRHAHAVATLMPRVEVWPEGDAPRDLARWLEVMLEALTEARIPLPATGARTWLARLSGKSRAATLAARLLDLPLA